MKWDKAQKPSSSGTYADMYAITSHLLNFRDNVSWRSNTDLGRVTLPFTDGRKWKVGKLLDNMTLFACGLY